MSDPAIYVEFSNTERGTLLRVIRGYNGPVIARLQWERKLSQAEQAELATAVRLGATHE